MRRARTYYLLLFVLVLAGCTGKSPYTDAQRKEMESRIFEADKETTFQSIVSVLQDKGYVLTQSDFIGGMLTGDSGSNTGLFGITRKHEVIATVQPYGKGRTKVRITFREQSSSGTTNWLTGASQTTARTSIISTPEMLTDVYERISKEIFLRKEMNK